tara:strand:+ start:75 stop:506 length:432 start_codon:yes stop_codon:yes gene_type:complete
MKPRYQSTRSHTDSEINILPLIDVLFAILIFFMLSSIVLTEKNKITVQRPTNSYVEKVSKAKKLITITLIKNKKLYLEDEEIGADKLSERLKLISKNESIEQVLIDADKTSAYGDIMEILEIVKEAGLNSIGLAVNKRNVNGQ